MSSYTMATTVFREFPETVELVRAALVEQGFGIITEIDMSATLKAKLDVDMPPQVILGACRPVLAHQALLADPSIATLLPCNVVVRSIDTRTTTVEAFDPAFPAAMADSDAVRTVATDARERPANMLETITKEG
ncbi:DUF302 domain-containing protein [Nocardioides sp. B-3]|uniref:DUF302 domain-containing protein n=1 Tax=Nocardioides sp. B-3 TaxID=2895565 RepID=UPI00215330B5|nr:DUF302 domain-containing protein [Nocardioides sp. B-3]UUZ60324.1 DUF302 domain-containing protein [Nocardioides sp. B-3]